MVKNLPTNAGDTGLTPAQPQINIKKKEVDIPKCKRGRKNGLVSLTYRCIEMFQGILAVQGHTETNYGLRKNVHFVTLSLT